MKDRHQVSGPFSTARIRVLPTYRNHRAIADAAGHIANFQARPDILRTANKKGNTMRQIQWQDRFNIGVRQIDQAHQQLFSIVQKMMDLYVERHEDKFACVEGIKFFKAYAFRHFAEEEDYMREIGYPDYLSHKKIHDKMRYETLPELERLLYQSDFSTEAVQRFIGVCIGWLTGHIIMEDQAIAAGRARELSPLRLDDQRSVVQAVITSPLQDVLGCQIQFVGRYSTKDVILNERLYQLTYFTQTGNWLRIILVIGQQALLRAAGLLFGMDFYDTNEIVCFAIQEIGQTLLQRAAVCFGRQADELHLKEGRFLSLDEFDGQFQEHPPRHSLLFHTARESFALCIDHDFTSEPPAA